MCLNFLADNSNVATMIEFLSDRVENCERKPEYFVTNN